MSELLYLFGEIDWRVKPIIFTVRKWAQTKEITKGHRKPNSNVTNFILTILVLFYLQQKKVLPSLQELKSKAGKYFSRSF